MAKLPPDADAQFDLWAANYKTETASDGTSFGLSAVDVSSAGGVVDAFHTSYLAAADAIEAARGAVAAKDAARAAAQTIILPQIRRLQAAPNMTNTVRERYRIPTRGTTPAPVPPPTAVPVASVEVPAPLTHKLIIVEGSTPDRVRLPEGVERIEILGKIGGTAPVTDDELAVLGSTTRARHTLSFSMADGGKTVYYRFRYVNPRQEKGPYSAMVAATIAA
jgi:hypothetical protein